MCEYLWFSNVSYPSSLECTIPCKNRSKNTREVYTPESIFHIIVIVNMMTLQRQAKSKKIVSIALHEDPSLRLRLHSNIVPRSIWRSSIPAIATIVATIVSVSVITGRISRVAIPVIPGRVVFTIVAIPVRVRCVVST